MRLNHECVRALLLTIEDTGFEDLFREVDIDNLVGKPLMKKFSDNDVKYTALLLQQAGYIAASNDGYDAAGNFLFSVQGLTWQGHHFLDTVRDNKVWSDTKKITSKFSSVSLSLVESIASNVITQIVSKQLHLD